MQGMDRGMERLARVTLTLKDGTKINVQAASVRYITTVTGGSQIEMDDARSYIVQESVATIHTAIDALWTEYET